MDSHVSKLLQDKLYDKRKTGALELESNIRTALADNNHDKIAKIVHQLCHDYAYAVHQPHARNGGLIGLAAAAIALGSEVARYMKEIVPPVLACFADQDARVRYYACESMYNIAKVAKGEVLIYFNDVFDALCKLAADTELSVKNGAELLDRLVKDIVSESAATYTSNFQPDAPQHIGSEDDNTPVNNLHIESPKAFSLPRFIPLLQERIHVINPFTRTFLVSWITLLDSIPDLELVAFLSSFLAGLLRFLSDPNPDVHTTTKLALDRFLIEIKRIAAVKLGVAESRRSREDTQLRAADSDGEIVGSLNSQEVAPDQQDEHQEDDADKPPGLQYDNASSIATQDDAGMYADEWDGEWIPGQDVQIDYQQILDILVTFLSETREEEVQVTAFKWIETFLDICPEDILVFTPRLLGQLLPALSHDVEHVKQAAARVNQALMTYIMRLPEEPVRAPPAEPINQTTTPAATPATTPGPAPQPKAVNQVNNAEGRRESGFAFRIGRKPTTPEPTEAVSRTPEVVTPEPPPAPAKAADNESSHTDLDYEAAVGALTDQFIHQHEATRVAALAWLIMLHRKSPRKILAIQEATFPALLKTLSDPAEAVVTRDLLLLSQISKSSDDSYFSSFMVNLLKLFTTDRRLLETRGNLIIRQLCLSLPPEKIYRTMADCLERDVDEDLEFASIMVQNLNNNLITAPELSDLRKRLRNLDSREGQTFFTVLFRAWCVNAVATFSLCLLAQAYEQAYELLKVFGDMEMTVNHLIQIDKLVQLLESPVFTYLRMQLLEPERYPFLYKCMYGVLMLLPQSSGFAALKNRLNSVSAIGYLHSVPRAPPTTTQTTATSYERQNRLKSREAGEGGIRWTELLDKFRATQERVRRVNQRHQLGANRVDLDDNIASPELKRAIPVLDDRLARPGSAASGARVPQIQTPQPPPTAHSRAKSSLSHLGRFTGKGRNKDKDKK